ncbi:MAG: HEAT repeat domain-containing protein [Cyanobacteria bacterium P01_D01_bin.128]
MSDSLAELKSAIDRADSAPSLAAAVKALANAKRVDAVPMLVEALGYNNPGAAVAAVDGLVKLGEPAVAGLLELLDLNNYTARSWAVRALAGIGDPRGLPTLLGAATADISLSVRRAAARGLGTMKWHWFPHHLLDTAQAEALDALLFVTQADEEWVVRYAAVVGLEGLGLTLSAAQSQARQQILDQLTSRGEQDDSSAVRARSRVAQENLNTHPPAQRQPVLEPQDKRYAPSEMEWEQILENLYQRKGNERRMLPEGDPARYRRLLETNGTQ